MNIEDVHQFCNSLEGTTESIKWEDHLCFCIGEKMYAITSLTGRPSLSIKVTEEEYNELVETPDFHPAPYLARYKWVATDDFTVVPDEELIALLRTSYHLIRAKIPKSKLKKLDGQG